MTKDYKKLRLNNKKNYETNVRLLAEQFYSDMKQLFDNYVSKDKDYVIKLKNKNGK